MVLLIPSMKLRKRGIVIEPVVELLWFHITRNISTTTPAVSNKRVHACALKCVAVFHPSIGKVRAFS